MILHFKRGELVDHLEKRIKFYKKQQEEAARQIEAERKKWFHSSWDEWGPLLRRAEANDKIKFLGVVLSHLPIVPVVFIPSEDLEQLELL